MSENEHYLRLKRGDVEFEIRGSSENVAAAWLGLREQVESAFAAPKGSQGGSGTTRREAPAGPPPPRARDEAEDETKKRRPRARRQPAPSGGPGSGERTEIQTVLATAPKDDFPDIGDESTAFIAGCAVLWWMRERHGVEGLTAFEVHSFTSGRLRLPNGVAAYRKAFARKSRAVDAVGRPAIFRLMMPGEKALEAYLAKRSEGATPAEAEKAGDEAEKAAEQAAA